MVLVTIIDVSPGMRNIVLAGNVIEISASRHVETRYGLARVASALIEDSTGSIRLNLWRDQIDAVAVGDIVAISNAFARPYRDELELNIGRDGKIFLLQRGRGDA